MDTGSKAMLAVNLVSGVSVDAQATAWGMSEREVRAVWDEVKNIVSEFIIAGGALWFDHDTPEATRPNRLKFVDLMQRIERYECIDRELCKDLLRGDMPWEEIAEKWQVTKEQANEILKDAVRMVTAYMEKDETHEYGLLGQKWVITHRRRVIQLLDRVPTFDRERLHRNYEHHVVISEGDNIGNKLGPSS